MTIGELSNELFTVGISCEMGERACAMFGAVDETMDTIDWYLYPIEIQRMLPAIMIATQKPIYVELFGSITASRETFGKVSEPTAWEKILLIVICSVLGNERRLVIFHDPS